MLLRSMPPSLEREGFSFGFRGTGFGFFLFAGDDPLTAVMAGGGGGGGASGGGGGGGGGGGSGAGRGAEGGGGGGMPDRLAATLDSISGGGGDITGGGELSSFLVERLLASGFAFALKGIAEARIDAIEPVMMDE